MNVLEEVDLLHVKEARSMDWPTILKNISECSKNSGSTIKVNISDYQS
jgi:hypothetical protein